MKLKNTVKTNIHAKNNTFKLKWFLSMFNLPANEKRHVQIIKNAIFVTIWEIYLNPKREIGIKITINAMSKYFKEEKL